MMKRKFFPCVYLRGALASVLRHCYVRHFIAVVVIAAESKSGREGQAGRQAWFKGAQGVTDDPGGDGWMDRGGDQGDIGIMVRHGMSLSMNEQIASA